MSAKIIDILARKRSAANPMPGLLMEETSRLAWIKRGRKAVQVYCGRNKWVNAYSDMIDRGEGHETYWEVFYLDGEMDLVSKAHVREGE